MRQDERPVIPELTDTGTLTIPPQQPSGGKMIGHYRLDSFLGRGGMGTVWKAEDVRLKRPVAIKLLGGIGGEDPDAAARFQIEAQAAAALDHPSVCTVYEIGQAAGIWYIAMAYIEGETIARKVGSGALDIALAASLAAQVADGLDAAHSRGIVHRDIKSANIIVTPQNSAKILDFGLARIGFNPGRTMPGALMGTPSYMSPEQLRGGVADHRSDIWSLGVVFYQMLSGRLPFRGDNIGALMKAIESAPLPLHDLRPEIPDRLEQIVYKALAERPELRYQSAAEMRDDLKSSERIPSVVRALEPALPSLAVLPFVNLTSDPEYEYFADGLTDELIGAISRLKGIKVVSRTSVFSLKGKTGDVQQVGAVLRVSSVLEGSVRKAGNRLRVNVQLVNVSDGFSIWSDRYDGVLDDIFGVQEDIAQKLIQALKVRIEGEGDLRSNRRTGSQEAYRLYLLGQFHLQQMNPAHLPAALEAFERALALDASYAPAHAGIARYFTRLGHFGMAPPGELFPRARAAAEKALQLDPQLPEAHATLGEVILRFEWNRPEAEKYLREAIRLAPGDANVRQPMALLLQSDGRMDESCRFIDEALDLDPLSKPLQSLLAWLYYYARRYEEALAVCDIMLALDPHYHQTLAVQGLVYAVLHRHEDAIRVLNQCSAGPYLAYACGLAGRTAEAREMLASAERRAQSAWVPPSALAAACIGVADYDRAFDYLERACEVRDPIMTVLGVLPIFDPLRPDPRFSRLLKLVGLPASFHPEKLSMSVSSRLLSTHKRSVTC
jgi:serine/threonine protein kinase/Tfp pilus assembly protein PilF